MAWDKVRFNGEDADGCIFTVIAGLSAFKDAQTTFVEFCKLHLKQADSVGKFKQKLYSHYVFSGPSGSGNHGAYPYAPKFAEFLEENKLGSVVGSEPTDNVKWHKGRKGQVFIWVPDQTAVEKWWDANVSATEAKVAPKGKLDGDMSRYY